MCVVRIREQILLRAVDGQPFLTVFGRQSLAKEPPHPQVRVDPREQHDEHPYEEAPEGHVRKRHAKERAKPEIERDLFATVRPREKHDQDENHQDDDGPGEATQVAASTAASRRPWNVGPVVDVSLTLT